MPATRRRGGSGCGCTGVMRFFFVSEGKWCAEMDVLWS